ncbi:MAG: hypothetical protein AAFP15_05065, partial [Bacteroidota bacterium]
RNLVGSSMVRVARSTLLETGAAVIMEFEDGHNIMTTNKSATKPATLESGATVNVPLFLNEGDVVRVDTTDGSYIERVSTGS